MFRKRIVFLAVLIMTGISALNAYAGTWARDGVGWWYVNDNGTYPKAAWEYIDGQWYHFNPNGYMETGWIRDKGSWYYCYGSGAMAHDTWIDGNYYVGSDGIMLVNTTTPDGYQVDANGKWIVTSTRNRKLTKEQAETAFTKYWDMTYGDSPAINYWNVESISNDKMVISERWPTGFWGEAVIDLYSGECVESGPYAAPGLADPDLPVQTTVLFNAWDY